MIDSVSDFADKISKAASSGSKIIDFYNELNTLSLQIVCRTAMGYKMNFDNTNAEDYRLVSEILLILLKFYLHASQRFSKC